MGAAVWLVVHLVAVAVLAGVGWVVQVVVYPAFSMVGSAEWSEYHRRHGRAITVVVALPWAVQGGSTVALLVAPPTGGVAWVVVLAALASTTVVATALSAVPAHRRLDDGGDRRVETRRLLRANLVRTLAWTGSTVLAAAMLQIG